MTASTPFKVMTRLPPPRDFAQLMRLTHEPNVSEQLLRFSGP